ncbi:MAG: hypothetical protein EXR63_01575 [Dehalococcoidia bacterium]|nr:hypothetical protein [Dehalococcoidia bacterium]
MNDTRPFVTLDLDGVICSPPFGVNVGISTRFLDADAAPAPARVPPHALSRIADRLRFDFRRPLPEAAAALRELQSMRRIVLLTGRRTSPERWLRRHGLADAIERVVINDTPMRSPHFKLALLAQLAPREHVDDDGRTAQLLAERSAVRVYLRDWPRNRDAQYAAGVERIADLAAFVRLVGAGEA